MVKCFCCNKFVHGACDVEADLYMYHFRKENDPDYDYICPPCKITSQGGGKHIKIPNQIRFIRDGDSCFNINSLSSTVTCFESVCKDPETETDDKYKIVRPSSRGKPSDSYKLLKKRVSFKDISRARPKFSFHKKNNFHDFARKRGPKGKIRNLILGGNGSQSNVDRNSNRITSDPASENKLVLCSAKDKYVLTQDICAMCGSIGIGQEGCLISCSQCGQCYHPYCVNIKVSKVILQKGWRCLDCTVCEGCGQKNDEARLILCDECDISYHIYCINPPLETVPQGNWKCKWCSMCQKCGSTTPGKNSGWKNNYSECGPCYSKSTCSFCSLQYTENELIIQCCQCERWLHCKCDSINSEQEAQRCDNDYTCILCRPKDKPASHILVNTGGTALKQIINTNGYENFENNTILTETVHYIDGVSVNEHGMQQIKSLQSDIKKKRKIKPINGEHIKDFGIIATIESVVAGTSVNFQENGSQDSKEIKEVLENYKDGMTWSSTDTNIPDGFSLHTNDEGKCFLRKKRQRNLQKLGIGGFVVKNRTLRKDFIEMHSVEGKSEFAISLEIDKKKKTVRKKHKNKIIETYPTYLQEAFFGKSLLDLEKPMYFESDSSESFENKESLTSDDVFLSLSSDERNIMNNTTNHSQSAFAYDNKTKFTEKVDSFVEIKSEKTSNKNDMQTIIQENSEQESFLSIVSTEKDLVDISSTFYADPFFKEHEKLAKNHTNITTEDKKCSYLLEKNDIETDHLSNCIISNFNNQVVAGDEKEEAHTRYQVPLHEVQKYENTS